LATVADEDVESVKVLFPQWKVGVQYEVGMRVRFAENVYKVLQAHTSQEDWAPNVAVSLFAALLIDEETGEIKEWEQPDSTNPYMIDDKVIYDGKTYVSIVDNNVWAPDTYGWEEVIEE
jgi:outer membrane protein assembly factor BamB